jgi:hypothetical protein
MVSEVALHVIRVSRKFDPAVAKESTFVYHVADNKCKVILHRYQTQSRAACDTVTLTDLLSRHLSADDNLRVREAADAVERVIEESPDAVRELLEMILRGCIRKSQEADVLAYLDRDKDLINEMIEAVRRCSATLDDFRLVLKYAVR